MGAKQMEAHLYYNYNLVGLKVTDNVNLLDVLVSVKGGTFSGKHILNLGSFSLYHLPDPRDDSGREDKFAALYTVVRKGLNILETGEYSDPDLSESIFKVRKDEFDYTERIANSTGLFAKLLELVKGSCSNAAEMHCTISNIWRHSVVDAAIHNVFLDGPAPWKPNMTKIARACDPRGGVDGAALEIWIVREKVFCEDIRFDDVHEASANASATVHGNSQALEAQAHHRAAVGRHTRGFYQLGFKAVRLIYDNDGKLLKWHPHMGDSMPTLRHSEREVDNPPSLHDKYQDYHLRAFFVEEPPSAESPQPDVSSVQLELLDIETLATESSSSI